MTRSLLLLFLVLSVAAFTTTLVYTVDHRIDHKAEAEYHRELRQLEAADTALNEQVLSVRSGLTTHYDGIERQLLELERAHRASRKIPGFLGASRGAALLTELERHAGLLQRKRAAIERFKSHSAILRNSLHFLPLAAERLARDAERAHRPELASGAYALLGSSLLLDVAPTPDARSRLARDIANLDAQNRDEPSSRALDSLTLLLSHARVVAEHEQEADALVRSILAEPTRTLAHRVEESYSVRYRDVVDAQTFREKAILALGSLIVFVGLLEIISRIRRAHTALASATEKLRQANLALALEREKERELGELKTRFVSMTSHEFRTPLSSILSSSELLEKYGERWDSERKKSHLGNIQASARGMSDMLEDILIIGRAEAGALKPSPAPLKLDEYCRNLLASLKNADGAGHTFQLSYSGEKEVNLDERLLTHVLANLLENALKYSAAGSAVTLEVEPGPAGCRFVVRDQGIGIPQADLPRLFKSFERGTNVGKVAGSGLGLAVAQRAVDVQGGTIRVESTLGSGSEFQVWLPRQSQAEHQDEALAS